MQKRSFKILWLALALVLGQWCTVVHASQHHLALASGDDDCQYGVYVQDFAAALPTPPKIAPTRVFHEQPAFVVTGLGLRHAPAYYAIRGPPLTLRVA